MDEITINITEVVEQITVNVTQGGEQITIYHSDIAWNSIFGIVPSEQALITMINSASAPEWSDLFTTIASEAELITLIENSTPNIGVNRLAIGNQTTGAITGYAYVTYTETSALYGLGYISVAAANLGYFGSWYGLDLGGFNRSYIKNHTNEIELDPYSGAGGKGYIGHSIDAYTRTETGYGYFTFKSTNSAIDAGFKADKFGVKIGKAVDLSGDNTYLFQIEDVKYTDTGIFYGGAFNRSFLQLHDTVAQIGNYNTRTQYFIDNIEYKVIGLRQFKMENGSLMRGDTDQPFFRLSSVIGTQYGYDTQYYDASGIALSLVTQNLVRMRIDPYVGVQVNLPMTVNVTAGDYGFTYNRAGGYTWKMNVDGSNIFRLGAVPTGDLYIAGEYYFSMPSNGNMRLGIGIAPQFNLDVSAPNGGTVGSFETRNWRTRSSLRVRGYKGNGDNQQALHMTAWSTDSIATPDYYTGTSVNKFETSWINSGLDDLLTPTKPLVFSASEIYGFAGSTATNYGFKIDPNGFRIDKLVNLNTSNTYAFEVSNGVSLFGGQINILDNVFFGGLGSPMAWVDIAGATVSQSQLRFRPALGTVVNDGDMSFDGTNLFMRINGVAKTVNFGSNVTKGTTNFTLPLGISDLEFTIADTNVLSTSVIVGTITSVAPGTLGEMAFVNFQLSFGAIVNGTSFRALVADSTGMAEGQYKLNYIIIN